MNFIKTGFISYVRMMSGPPYARKRDPERFGIAETYGWREDKRRQYADPQRAGFGAYLRGRGFSFE